MIVAVVAAVADLRAVLHLLAADRRRVAVRHADVTSAQASLHAVTTTVVRVATMTVAAHFPIVIAAQVVTIDVRVAIVTTVVRLVTVLVVIAMIVVHSVTVPVGMMNAVRLVTGLRDRVGMMTGMKVVGESVVRLVTVPVGMMNVVRLVTVPRVRAVMMTGAAVVTTVVRSVTVRVVIAMSVVRLVTVPRVRVGMMTGAAVVTSAVRSVTARRAPVVMTVNAPRSAGRSVVVRSASVRHATSRTPAQSAAVTWRNCHRFRKTSTFQSSRSRCSQSSRLFRRDSAASSWSISPAR